MSGMITQDYYVDYPVQYEIHPEKETPFQHLRRVTDTSNYMANQRKPEPPYSCNYYQRPYLYFWADGNYLKCLGTGIKIKCDAGADIDSQLKDQDVQKEINLRYGLLPEQYSAFCDIYCHLHYMKFTDYYKALMAFKWETGLVQFPLFDLKKNLKVVDGRLLRLVWDEKRKAEIRTLLTARVVAEEIKRWGGKDVGEEKLSASDKSRFDKVAGRLAQLAIEYHGEARKNDEEKSEFKADLSWGTVHYIPALNQMEIIYTVLGWPWNQHIPQNPVLSVEGKDSLRNLTAGNIENLNNIAELVARLHMPEKPSEYLWVVLGELCNVVHFIQLITLIAGISGNEIGTAVYRRSENTRNLQLFYEQCAGCKVQINENLLESDAFEKMHTVLKKFVSGDEVGKFNDPFIPNGSVKGKGVVIYKSINLKFQAPKNIPFKVIRVPQKCKFLGNSDEDIRWMQSYLLTLGYQIVLYGGFGPQRENQTVDEVLEQFIAEFCSPEKGKWIDRKEFYDMFEKYCHVCHHVEDEFPIQKDLFERVRKLTGWEEKEVRQNNNRKGFINVRLNKEQVEKAIQEAEIETKNMGNMAFDSYLDSLSNLLAQPQKLKPKARIVY